MTSCGHSPQFSLDDNDLSHSPPPSPPWDDAPVVLVDEWGMVVQDVGGRAVTPVGHQNPAQTGQSDAGAPGPGSSRKNLNRTPRPRRKVTYVSRHFANESENGQSSRSSTSSQSKRARFRGKAPAESAAQDLVETSTLLEKSLPLSSRRAPRVYSGVNIDNWSSDSSLTDVPEDIGHNPFTGQTSPTITAITKSKTKARKHPTVSPYFPSPQKHRVRPHFLSTLPFPPLSHSTFGLMQERLSHDPFRLLIATIFLNKTPGERAMPVFFGLMERYPTPKALSEAELADVTEMIRKLGFQNQRARKCIAMARMWVERPPEKGKRYRKGDYPVKGDGRDVKADEILGDEDDTATVVGSDTTQNVGVGKSEMKESPGGIEWSEGATKPTRVAWEISHLPGVGAYAHDSWRMFCRDQLRAKALGFNGDGSADASFEPEWKRVLPLDKELRAWMTWMWLKEGWVWDMVTGKRTRASEELMAKASGGGVVVEEEGKTNLTLEKSDLKYGSQKLGPQRPAGKILEDVKVEKTDD